LVGEHPTPKIPLGDWLFPPNSHFGLKCQNKLKKSKRKNLKKIFREKLCDFEREKKFRNFRDQNGDQGWSEFGPGYFGISADHEGISKFCEIHPVCGISGSPPGRNLQNYSPKRKISVKMKFRAKIL